MVSKAELRQVARSVCGLLAFGLLAGGWFSRMSLDRRRKIRLMMERCYCEGYVDGVNGRRLLTPPLPLDADRIKEDNMKVDNMKEDNA